MMRTRDRALIVDLTEIIRKGACAADIIEVDTYCIRTGTFFPLMNGPGLRVRVHTPAGWGSA